MAPEIEKTLARLDHLTEKERSVFFEQLQMQINWLINNNFTKLIQILYRLDVDENKLRSLLQQQQSIDTATLIANLIIERQLKKAAAQNQKKNDTHISAEEGW